MKTQLPMLQLQAKALWVPGDTLSTFLHKLDVGGFPYAVRAHGYGSFVPDERGLTPPERTDVLVEGVRVASFTGES
jgi:hypothetical protein